MRACLGAPVPSWPSGTHVRAGVMQLMFMQVSTRAAGQPHLQCSTASGTALPQQARQQAECRPNKSELQWLQRRAASTPTPDVQHASLSG